MKFIQRKILVHFIITTFTAGFRVGKLHVLIDGKNEIVSRLPELKLVGKGPSKVNYRDYVKLYDTTLLNLGCL